jgi:hypothetical protein
MPALLTPPPDRLVTVGRTLDSTWRNERPSDAPGTSFGAASCAEQPDHDDAVQVDRLEREHRWVCEWWPPD